MQYPIEKIDQAIFGYLSLNPEKVLSLHTIYNGIYVEKLCPDLETRKDINKRVFISKCHMMDKLYKNVHKVYRHDVDNTFDLVFSMENKEDITKHMTCREIIKEDEKFSLDYCDVISYVLENPASCSDYSVTEYLDGVNNMLQIAIKNNRIDLVIKLLTNYKFNLDEKNKLGESVFDMTKNTDILKILFECKYEEKITDLKTKIDGIRDNSTVMASKMRDMQEKINDIQSIASDKDSEIRKLQNQLNFYKPMCIGMFLVFVLKMMF